MFPRDLTIFCFLLLNNIPQILESINDQSPERYVLRSTNSRNYENINLDYSRNFVYFKLAHF